jgi:tetratricopeptide (TPR) repeat protein
MKKVAIIFLLFAIIPYTGGQDSDDYNRRLYQSYVKSEMHLWKGIIEEMNQEYEISKNKALLYDLCFAWYGYIGYLINKEDNKSAKKELRDAELRAAELGEILNDRHDVMALRGALTGYRIVLSKFTSLYLGPRALKYINTAYESADTCFNCNVEMGSRFFYSPRILGGSKKEAVQHYEKAVELLETSPLKAEHNWIYMNTVLMLANAYKETSRMELACKLYKQLLEYEPEADWVRNKLYSKCQQD